jgi:hypothetical protein
MPYTGRQIELIRARIEAFYNTETLSGLGKLTWGGICDDIYGKTGVNMDPDVLRQFVLRVERRGGPRVPSDKNLEAMVLYLTHPDITLLSLEELEEPDRNYGDNGS